MNSNTAQRAEPGDLDREPCRTRKPIRRHRRTCCYEQHHRFEFRCIESRASLDPDLHLTLTLTLTFTFTFTIHLALYLDQARDHRPGRPRCVGLGSDFFYANVLNGAPGALDTDDLSEALETTVVEADDEPGLETATSAAALDEAAADSEHFDGLWTPIAASEFGYSVDEVLGGVNVTAVGRSSEIDGSLTIEGTTALIDATVEVENIVSDDSRRDGQFQGRIMDVANFPTANFQRTEPVDFGAIPADGEQVTATAVGELTLKGVTQAVTVDVTAQATDTSIGVLGNIPITFTDYGIDNPSNPGVGLEDGGIVEFVLVFERG